MENIATFDFGTTAIKCVILDENQNIVFFKDKEIKTYINGNLIEQDPEEWYKGFIELIHEYIENFGSNLSGIVFSGQMQDLIFVDKDINPLYKAILYNDQRGESQLNNISDKIIQSIKRKTANDLNGSIPLTKILWFKNYYPDLYFMTYKILFSPKDYITAKLTENFVGDVTNLSTCGIMNIVTKKYMSELKEIGVDISLFPKICFSDEVAGFVSEKGEAQTGIKRKTKIYVGSGDAGATTLASGIISEGEININLGTSGWVASISSSLKKKVFNLCAVNKGLYINVIPVLNGGNVHKWIAAVMDDKIINKYDLIHEKINESPPASNGLFFLPYILGERFPYSDPFIKGCFIGINPDTTKADIIRATLEGVAYSIKQCLLALKIMPKKISLIGGGAKEKRWNQIFADILGTDVTVFENSEFLPAMALASIVMLEQKKISSYEEFINGLIKRTKYQIYHFNFDNNQLYEKAFKKFLKIYPSVKNLFL